MSASLIIAKVPIGGLHWPTVDPFLFCANHDDVYPKGNEAMGPDASLAGRNIGMDFEGKDGWRMYHGDVVPGFPRHPHRGFETITILKGGYCDHSDSMGATARFGPGDLQWMTAGRGIVHSEMFPLRERDAENPLGLFQIWLNLPSTDKLVDPYFTMLWREDIPVVEIGDAGGPQTKLTIYAGEYEGHKPPPPPPNSWASRPESELRVWTMSMNGDAEFTIPSAGEEVIRTLYFLSGSGIVVGGEPIDTPHAIQLVPGVEIPIQSDGDNELMLLQGRPIGEPVAQQGPFVMNTKQEIQQTIMEYRRTGFGGWPWDADGPVHAREQGRFAIHADGRREDAPAD